MKLSDIRPDLDDEVGGLFQIGLLGRIRVEPEIAERRRQDVVGGIQHVNAAILEFCQILGLEDDVPTVDLRIVTENLLHGLYIIAYARGATLAIVAVTI